ncbi:unnamed protein product, partial [Mesorhabditis belari]|uniref:Glucosylceramidase n=1 Tax=Mesorhabditis belari TaxID=2138241 RepID=A0AAF3F851_9BILA
MAFNAFSLLPGIKERHVRNIKANQFILTVHNEDQSRLLYQKCLTAASFSSKSLSEWEIDFPKEKLHYRGLYPRSWTTFTIEELSLELTCEIVSPVIPDNYKDSSFPTSCFLWSIKNEGTQNLHITLTFTFRNGTGNPKFAREAICRAQEVDDEEFFGVEIVHSINEMPTNFGIYSDKAHETSANFFNPNGDGDDLWTSLKHRLKNDALKAESQEIGVALSQRFESRSKSSTDARFALVWHMPIVKFAGERQFRRRYIRFFSTSLDAGFEIGKFALKNVDLWKEEIERFQKPILHSLLLPDWFKSCLLNELYFISDGSTLWFEFDENWRKDEPGMSDFTADHYKEFGRFGYVESWEYLMVNTYDVHFYASWALFELWPQLELGIQLDFSDQFRAINLTSTQALQGGEAMVQKKTGRIPHDVGNPKGEPWLEVNAYSLHDTNEWKDLNLKYILLSYRDFRGIVEKCFDKEKSKQFLEFFYDRSVEIIERGLMEWDTDKDGIIENNGTPDQTYDIWSMNGTSAYCGSLWVTAVECVRRMAEQLEKDDDRKRFTDLLQKARTALVGKLWTGSYFAFDENPDNRSLVMSDQLCGFWFLSLIDGEICGDVLGENGGKMIDEALKTIYEKNLKSVFDGELGPINGIRTNGQIDLGSIQSEEICDIVKGLEFASGIFHSCYERFGLQYQTPEAIFPKNYYRAIGYLRPLSIWATPSALKIKMNINKDE